VRLPVSIEPCPIVDATAELRFEPAVPSAVAVGLAYERLVKKFPRVSPLQIIPFPDEFHKINPALAHQAQFRFESDEYVALLGPTMFAVGVNGPYTKWPRISPNLQEAFDLIRETKIVGVPIRFGFKYMNFFPGNALSNLNVTFNVADTEIAEEGTLLQTQVLCQPFKILLQIITGAQITSRVLPVDPNTRGTLLSLDCFKEQSFEADFLEKISENLELAHNKEKELFFRLLKDEFIQTLNPKYEPAK